MKEQEQKLTQEIEALLERARVTDAQEDARWGADQGEQELPKELQRRQDRLAKIQAAKARVEERQAQADRERGRHPEDGQRRGDGAGRPFKRGFGVPEDKAQDNFTDPESRIMKLGGSFEQCYNAQAVVDADSQLIVASGLGNNAADNEELVPMVEAVKDNLGELPKTVLADTGFRSEDSFAKLETEKYEGMEVLVALGREGKDQAAIDPKQYPATVRMVERLASPEGQAHYRRRKAIVEPVFGWIKHAMGFRQFSLRGLDKVTGEWGLVCLALNLRRMWVLQS
jgi:Transposase DDE domain